MIGCNPFFWFGFGLWWIFPVIMLALCFFMMRRCMGRMMHDKRFHHAPSEIPSNREDRSSSLTAIEIAQKN